MFLALRDRLNSPLQTLVLQADDASSERARGAIDRLVDLSRELATIEMTVPPGALSIDADRELRRQI
jgi:hypothetical protein